MSIELYTLWREKGMTREEIQAKKSLSEGTVWTLELGYQRYLKKLPLDKAVEVILSGKTLISIMNSCGLTINLCLGENEHTLSPKQIIEVDVKDGDHLYFDQVIQDNGNG